MNAIHTVTLNPAVDKTVTVENFSFGELNRIKTTRTDAGGKGINVAKVLHRFSVPVKALGFQAGHEGKVILEKLREQGIPSYLIEAEGETRTNLKVVDERTKQTTELNEAGFSPSEALLGEFVERFELSLSEASLVVLGGSLPPGTPVDYYKRLIELANRQGVRTILDADGEALALGIEAVPFALKPNIHELEALFDSTFTTDEQIIYAAQQLIRKGISYVIVSMGGEGSILVSEREAIRAKPFPITPLSTVGAGDSMVAAMAYCFVHGKSFEDMARWTSAAGTVTASKSGTEVCTLDEVQDKLGLVDIFRLTIEV
ncbi:1-phosphofructokinase [Paenibacillus harenae]|uniref:Tagatose-6-phosphate kinase n=1 Tax=Paenibacillus harenae TaxID=306543 RepID=A0ABT9UAY6_PAEHA|nr:1-phosphofructokinase [Paenibacillus harenae]MDQ0062145.1 1-phosphofructokinase [Paenibacillus harenae]MDQ0115870.1 1-phosphofructokinase [Paenibacillus harenae]